MTTIDCAVPGQPLTHSRAAFVRGEAEPAGEENDAAWLLRFYNTFLADANQYDVTQAALNSLATLRGNFAFVLYDAGGTRALTALALLGVILWSYALGCPQFRSWRPCICSVGILDASST